MRSDQHALRLLQDFDHTAQRLRGGKGQILTTQPVLQAHATARVQRTLCELDHHQRSLQVQPVLQDGVALDGSRRGVQGIEEILSRAPQQTLQARSGIRHLDALGRVGVEQQRGELLKAAGVERPQGKLGQIGATVFPLFELRTFLERVGPMQHLVDQYSGLEFVALAVLGGGEELRGESGVVSERRGFQNHVLQFGLREVADDEAGGASGGRGRRGSGRGVVVGLQQLQVPRVPGLTVHQQEVLQPQVAVRDVVWFHVFQSRAQLQEKQTHLAFVKLGVSIVALHALADEIRHSFKWHLAGDHHDTAAQLSAWILLVAFRCIFLFFLRTLLVSVLLFLPWQQAGRNICQEVTAVLLNVEVHGDALPNCQTVEKLLLSFLHHTSTDLRSDGNKDILLKKIKPVT